MPIDPVAVQENQRWKLTIAYDGRTYGGWQSQPGSNTIQDLLEQALSRVTKTDRVMVHGSGRTDAGVHAWGQVAHFDAPDHMHLPADAWVRATNVHLPPTIRVMGCVAVSREFHARFSAKLKTYRYKIVQSEVLSPFENGLAWHVRRHLDLEKLRKGARRFTGCHDFRNFSANRGKNIPPPKTTVRTLNEIGIEQHENELWITMTGDGFLYRMVRMIVGTLVQFASGQISFERLENLLLMQTAMKTSACAPSSGLYLQSVVYPEAAPAVPT